MAPCSPNFIFWVPRNQQLLVGKGVCGLLQSSSISKVSRCPVQEIYKLWIWGVSLTVLFANPTFSPPINQRLIEKLLLSGEVSSLPSSKIQSHPFPTTPHQHYKRSILLIGFFKMASLGVIYDTPGLAPPAGVIPKLWQSLLSSLSNSGSSRC